MSGIHYARAGQLNLAYQVVGDGPIDLVFVPHWYSHLEVIWEEPALARALRRLATFSRLILFDRRGSGLSDSVVDPDLLMLEHRVDDVRAVLDAVGSDRAALFGALHGGMTLTVFAATHPDRTSALAVLNTGARFLRSGDYPFGVPPRALDAEIERLERGWGRDYLTVRQVDPRIYEWMTRHQRLSMGPGTAATAARAFWQDDVRPALPAVRVPTLVLHRDVGMNPRGVDEARYLADHIPDARFVELSPLTTGFWLDDPDPVIEELQLFLTGSLTKSEPDRVLATVLFTDIVESTQRSALMGDRRWRDTMDAHDTMVRRQLDRFQGREVKTTGDGFLAIFDGPGRAIACGKAVMEAAHLMGLELRVGLHTGECERRGEDVTGLAVTIAKRILDLASPGEILSSRTVKDLVAGSTIVFLERGTHALKGVPGEWHLFAVER